MLYFLLTWNLLTIACWITGIPLLNLTRAQDFDRIGDRLIIVLWSGLVLLSISLLAVSFILPLSPLIGLMVSGLFGLAALFSVQTRAELARLKAACSLRWLSAILGLELLTATLVNRPMEWFDSGGYHTGAIRWLAEAGTVPGLALINYAFGFTSSWFAFTAPLVPESLGHRLGAVANGFVFFLAIFHLLVSCFHLWQRCFRVSDGFAIGINSVITAAYVATIFTGSPILVSFSPDVPVTIIVGVIAWTILVIKEADETGQFSAKAIDGGDSILDVKILPLLLGIGALSLKLSALPTLAIVMLFYAVETRFALKKLLIGGVLVIVLSAPMMGYGVMTSACPFFPSTAICLDLPWRFPEEMANRYLRETKVLNLDESPEADSPAAGNSSSALAQRLLWIKTQRKMQIMVLLYVLSIAVSLRWLVFSPNRKTHTGAKWVMSLGLIGMTFIIFYAPLIRFGLIYFILIPALYFSQFVNSKLNTPSDRPRVITQLSSRFNSSLSGIVIGITCILVIILSQDQRNLFSLLPLELPKPELIEAQVNDIKYTYPADWTYKCWATARPCSGILLEEVRLRDPEQGIDAGFIAAN